MEKLMTIFGAFFFASVVLTSCGDVNVKNLDRDIEEEEDAVEALLTLGDASFDVMESLKGSLEEIAALKERVEDIEEAGEDIHEKIREEELDQDDIQEDNEIEDMFKNMEDMREELEELMEDVNKVLNTLRL